MIPWRTGPTFVPAAVYHYSSPFARGVLPRRFVAFTLGRHVYTWKDELSLSVMREEEVHVDQWFRYGRFGLGFLVRYVWWTIRFGYWNNPLEVEARHAALSADLRL